MLTDIEQPFEHINYIHPQYDEDMVLFIKSKNEQYFNFLSKAIDYLISQNNTITDISNELNALKDLNKSLKHYILDSISELVEDDRIDNSGYETEIDNDELYALTNNEFFRQNQIDAINKMKEQQFISGINCQIMGAGKSFIILNTIWEHLLINRSKKIYIILTERIEILKKWFKTPVYDDAGNVINYKMDTDKFKEWKNNGIIDIEQFILDERFDCKKEFNFDFTSKPTIFVCNNAFMKARSRFQNIPINKIALILVDECHSVHDRNHTMLMHFKLKGIHIIGFSATPVRPDNESKENLVKIYSNNGTDKINLISNYTLIDALRDNIVLPFKHYILNPKYDDSNKKIISEQFLKYIYDKYINNNPDLPFKKGVGWVRNINCIRKTINENSLIDNPVNNPVVNNHVSAVKPKSKRRNKASTESMPLIEVSKPVKPKKRGKSSIQQLEEPSNSSNVSSIVEQIELPKPPIIVGSLFQNINRSFQGFDIMRTYSGINGINQIDDFYNKESNSLLLCVNRCKEGSDIKFLDFGMFLDSVKSRGINIWLQMAGRIMRPDNENVNLRRKKYAVILECLKLDEDKNITIEKMTVDKIIDYYKMILNLSSYEVDDNQHMELMNKFKRLYENTHIRQETNQIEIDLLGNGLNKCIIQFDETIIDWSKFQDFLRAEVNEKIQRTKEDDFNETINIIKTLDVFQQDVNFWTEYAKLDHHSLKIMNVEMLKNNYMDIWNVKTWYDVLGTTNKIQYAELQIYIMSKGLTYIDRDIYLKLCALNNNIPIYPDEFYKYKGWSNYDNLITTTCDFL